LTFCIDVTVPIDRAKENPHGEIRFGLYHRKNNVGALLQPRDNAAEF
jgi:hypothetical protein